MQKNRLSRTSYLENVGHEHQNAVFHRKTECNFLNAQLFLELRALAAQAASKKARFCLHSSPQDNLHQMIVVLVAGAVDRAHTHPHPELIIMLKGRGRLVYLHSDGELSATFLSPLEVFCARVPSGQIHYMEVFEDWIAWLETVPGPFTSESTKIVDHVPRDSFGF